MPVPVVLDRSLAARYGIGRRRLEGPEFEHVTRGAYVPAVLAQDVAAQCRAVAHVRPDLVMSHWTAVLLHELPLPPGRTPGLLDVTAGPGTWPPRRTGVRGHTAGDPVATVRVRGLPVTTPARTWLDLARDGATAGELVVVGDALLHEGLLAPAAVACLVGPDASWRGVRSARSAMTLLDGRSESPMESWLRVLLLVAGLPAPDVQHVVTHQGRFVARVDLAWPEHRLAVEYDGAHHLERRQHVADLHRREALERAGWTVVVLMAEDVLGDPAGTVARVAARLP